MKVWPKTYYVVSGYYKTMRRNSPWFNALPKQNGWINFIFCKTLAHAKRQYLRLPVKTRQLDMKSTLETPMALAWGRTKP